MHLMTLLEAMYPHQRCSHAYKLKNRIEPKQDRAKTGSSQNRIEPKQDRAKTGKAKNNEDLSRSQEKVIWTSIDKRFFKYFQQYM